MDSTKRKLNERKFDEWTDTESGRIYKKIIAGKFGWHAEYIKIVNHEEETLEFIQNIYDENGNLAEVHEKFPLDKGHKKL